MASKLLEVTDLLHAERYGQPLSDYVADRRDQGASWRTIARDLEDRLGVQLTDVTLISWFDPKPKAAA